MTTTELPEPTFGEWAEATAAATTIRATRARAKRVAIFATAVIAVWVALNAVLLATAGDLYMDTLLVEVGPHAAPAVATVLPFVAAWLIVSVFASRRLR